MRSVALSAIDELAQLPSVYRSPAMDVECRHCHALRYRSEPKGMCCASGKVQMQLPPDLPEELHFDFRAFYELLDLFAPVYDEYTPYSEDGHIRRILDSSRGRPRSLRAVDCLGLSLAWTRTRGSSMVRLCMLFGIKQTVELELIKSHPTTTPLRPLSFSVGTIDRTHLV